MLAVSPGTAGCTVGARTNSASSASGPRAPDARHRSPSRSPRGPLSPSRPSAHRRTTVAPWTCSAEPLPVAGGLRFRDLSVGGGHSCGVTTDGRSYCWGRNDYGQLGNGSREPSAAPTRVLLRLEGAPVRSPP